MNHCDRCGAALPGEPPANGEEGIFGVLEEAGRVLAGGSDEVRFCDRCWAELRMIGAAALFDD